MSRDAHLNVKTKHAHTPTWARTRRHTGSDDYKIQEVHVAEGRGVCDWNEAHKWGLWVAG